MPLAVNCATTLFHSFLEMMKWVLRLKDVLSAVVTHPENPCFDCFNPSHRKHIKLPWYFFLGNKTMLHLLRELMFLGGSYTSAWHDELSIVAEQPLV